jgi:hypothetical protein
VPLTIRGSALVSVGAEERLHKTTESNSAQYVKLQAALLEIHSLFT